MIIQPYEAPDVDVADIEFPKKLLPLFEPHRFKVLEGGRDGMKCLATGTRVIMSDGSLRAVEDVRVGECVMGPDSLPRRVLDTTRGISPMYRVKQTLAMDYVVNEAHILSLKRSESSKRPVGLKPSGRYRWPRGRYGGWPDVANVQVTVVAEQSERWRRHFQGYRAGLLHFPSRALPIDPYMLGVWLGDGTGRELRVTAADPEIIEFCRSYAKQWGGDITLYGKKGACYDMGFKIKRGRTNPLWQEFKKLGLPSNKHIPFEFIANSETARLALLAGLIDTDGHQVRHSNAYEIAQVNERLARDIKYLADTLGFKTGIAKKKTMCCTATGVIRGWAWYVLINGDVNRIPCKVARKVVSPEKAAKRKRNHLLSTVSVAPVGIGEYAGFTLDGDHLFLLEDGTVTHNSWSIARALLVQGCENQERVLCTREVQRTLADSVHKLLADQIKAMNMGYYYQVQKNTIIGINHTEFLFAGIHDLTADNLKSYEGITKCWVEEAHRLTKNSWNTLEPTIRKDGSEIWLSFNPDMDTDFVWTFFIEEQQPDAVVIHVTWRDNPWRSKVLDARREKMRRDDPEEYEHIYEGRCNTVVPGAIYAKEVINMVQTGRIRNVPYDPRLKVHRIWDLGWNDSMTVIFAQRLTSEVRIIDYIEDDHRLLTDVLAEAEGGYRRGWVWGKDWLPHDGGNAGRQTGKSDAEVIRKLRGRNAVNVAERIDPEIGIRAARMMFPRVYIDKSDRPVPEGMGGFRGPARLIDCLKRYRRTIPITTMEPGAPLHDEYSHGCDAWRELALRVDQMTNDDRPAPPKQEPYVQSVPGVM